MLKTVTTNAALPKREIHETLSYKLLKGIERKSDRIYEKEIDNRNNFVIKIMAPLHENSVTLIYACMTATMHCCVLRSFSFVWKGARTQQKYFSTGNTLKCIWKYAEKTFPHILKREFFLKKAKTCGKTFSALFKMCGKVFSACFRTVTF